MMLDLRQLRQLLALQEHGNFSRAAEALHISQPALSRSLQAMENTVGTAIFERQRGNIVPTDMGRMLLQHAQTMTLASRDLDREIRLARGLDLGELRVGVGPFGASSLIGPVVGRLNRAHPHLRIRLVIAPWGELPERARAREVDVVVAELSEIALLEDFDRQALTQHASEVVCRMGHPLTTLKRPGAADLFRFPWIGPRLPLHVHQALLLSAPADMRETLQRSGPLTVECDSASVLTAILMESDAISMLPVFMADLAVRQGQLRTVPGLSLGIQSQYGAAWLRNRSMSGPALKFLELLQAHDATLAA